MTHRERDGMDPWTLGASLPEDEGVGALIETPGVILARMKEVDSIVQVLERDIETHLTKIRPMFADAWGLFFKEWTEFYESHGEGWSGWASRLWGATAEQVQSFHERAKKWREGYEKEAGVKATGPSIDDKGIPWKWILYASIAVGGIVAIGYTARGIRGFVD